MALEDGYVVEKLGTNHTAYARGPFRRTSASARHFRKNTSPS
jgi:hypothetical protein